MGRTSRGGKIFKFFLEPAEAYALNEMMQKRGFNNRGHLLAFLLRQQALIDNYRGGQAKRLKEEMESLGLSVQDLG